MISRQFERLFVQNSRTTSTGIRSSWSPRSYYRSVRHNSTQSSGNPPRNSSLVKNVLGFLAFGAGVGATLTITERGPQLWSTLESSRNSQTFNSSPGLNNSYGSVEDFKKAIDELRAAFPGEDTVSTDPEVLSTHGFSDNDYHPGAL